MGVTRFNTGKPCARGHLSDRFASSGNCVACSYAAGDRRRAENPESTRAIWRRAGARWRASNLGVARENSRRSALDWAEKNPDRAAAGKKKRRAAVKAAVPPDFGDFDQFVMEEAESACRRRAERHGEPFHIDHIVPLARGGMHAWHNIQVIPARLNLRKRDRMMYQTIAEWIADA